MIFTAKAAWLTMLNGHSQPLLQLLPDPQWVEIETLSVPILQSEEFFGVIGDTKWEKLFTKYQKEFRAKMLALLLLQDMKEVPADVAEVQKGIERKLDWVFFKHSPLVTGAFPLPIFTPKIMDAMITSLSTIENAIMEVCPVLFNINLLSASFITNLVRLMDIPTGALLCSEFENC